MDEIKMTTKFFRKIVGNVKFIIEFIVFTVVVIFQHILCKLFRKKSWMEDLQEIG